MKVSVLMITYNHEKYIRQAIESVLTQQTTFDFELIIANDSSTDNSDSVISNYLKLNKNIKYFCHNDNIGMYQNFKFAHLKARGEYIAICEGDDFWIDTLKLQKQVDFLETHKDYSLCYTRFNTLNQNTKEITKDFNEKYFQNKEDAIDFNFEIFQKGWHIGTQTLIFRNAFFNIDVIEKFTYFKDTHLIAHLLKKGKGACLNFVAATYRIHDGGIHTSVSAYNGYKIGYNCHKEIYLDNKTNLFLKKKYMHSFQNFITANIQEAYLYKAFWMSIKIFFINWSVMDLLRNFKRILKKGLI